MCIFIKLNTFRIMKKIASISIIIIVFASSLFAQDPQFSQTSLGNINLNPALAGNDSCTRLGVNYRNQWPNISANYVTMSANFYQYIPKLNAYAGINYMNDNQARGILKTNIFSVFYSQNINIKNVLIRPSIEVCYGEKTVDLSKLSFGSTINYNPGTIPQWPPDYNQSILKKNYLDLNIGTIVYYKNLLLGLSAHHITQPDEGLLGPSKVPIRFGVQFGYTLRLNKISISPFMYYVQQQNFQLLTGGVSVLFLKHINIALSYRNNDAVILNFGYQNKLIAINYSYDVTVSKLSGNTAGSHEVGLAFKFWRVKTKKRFIGVSSVFS
jgi:type IX secretion system PorP/SprF family membrane protein